MYLKRLRIRNFRNIANEVIEFSKGINIFIGENAQGKSSLLEAIYFLSTGRSFRGSSLSDLIAYNQTYFSVEAEIVKDNINEYLSIYFDLTTKKIIYNDTLLNLFSQLLGLMPSVILAPQDLQLIIGYPATRRRFLNMHIAQFDPLYVYNLTRYTKAMKHRNALLKYRKLSGIEAFEAQMEVAGKYLIEQRSLAIKALNEKISQYYLKMSPKEAKLYFKYLPSCNLEDIYGIFRKNIDKEIMLKSTIQGPHRDDMSLILDDKPAKSFASEGQKRTILAALKFAEFDRLKYKCEEMAILGVDDFGVHLDETKQELLFNSITDLNQSIITSPTNLNSSFEGKRFKVDSGSINSL